MITIYRIVKNESVLFEGTLSECNFCLVWLPAGSTIEPEPPNGNPVALNFLNQLLK